MKKTIDKLPCQSSSMVPETDHLSSGKTSSHKDDINLPIGIKKGTRSCTTHPISNYISYNFLPSSYRSFVSSLSTQTIAKNWRGQLWNLSEKRLR